MHTIGIAAAAKLTQRTLILSVTDIKRKESLREVVSYFHHYLLHANDLKLKNSLHRMSEQEVTPLTTSLLSFSIFPYFSKYIF